MLRGFYTAASGMIAQQRHQEAISNNIANVNTPGYKADQSSLRSFPEMLLQQMGSKHVPTQKGLNFKTSNPIGSMATGVYMQEMVPDFSQGAVRETGQATDMAILTGDLPDENGGLFFTVTNENGDIRYTRNGHFTVDGEGYLTANHGYYVLDRAGNRIQTNGSDFQVGANGTIQADGINTDLNIAYIANTNDLVKEANDLLSLTEGEALQAPEASYQIAQNTLEGSNVDPMLSMTEMMNAYRNFEQNQRVLKTYDESMGKAVNEIARLG